MLPVSGVAAPPPARGEGYPGSGLNSSLVLLGAAAVGCCCCRLLLLVGPAAVGCCGLLWDATAASCYRLSLQAAATAAAAAAPRPTNRGTGKGQLAYNSIKKGICMPDLAGQLEGYGIHQRGQLYWRLEHILKGFARCRQSLKLYRNKTY